MCVPLPRCHHVVIVPVQGDLLRIKCEDVKMENIQFAKNLYSGFSDGGDKWPWSRSLSAHLHRCLVALCSSCTYTTMAPDLIQHGLQEGLPSQCPIVRDRKCTLGIALCGTDREKRHFSSSLSLKHPKLISTLAPACLLLLRSLSGFRDVTYLK